MSSPFVDGSQVDSVCPSFKRRTKSSFNAVISSFKVDRLKWMRTVFLALTASADSGMMWKAFRWRVFPHIDGLELETA